MDVPACSGASVNRSFVQSCLQPRSAHVNHRVDVGLCVARLGLVWFRCSCLVVLIGCGGLTLDTSAPGCIAWDHWAHWAHFERRRTRMQQIRIEVDDKCAIRLTRVNESGSWEALLLHWSDSDAMIVLCDLLDAPTALAACCGFALCYMYIGIW